MSTSTSGLSGRGMQQSPEQWQARGEVLSGAMADLIALHRPRNATTALDVGCQAGSLVDDLAERTGLEWQGIDPTLVGEQRSPNGARLLHGWADQLAFEDESFDVLLFANVFEHIPPEKRIPSLVEMARVLKPGGVIVGQIPNPYFLVESHSRLPFMGMLPERAQKRYWRYAPVPWDHDFYSVTLKDLAPVAAEAGLLVRHTSKFNYPDGVYPSSVQWVVKALRPIMRHYPWAFQFVLLRPTTS